MPFAREALWLVGADWSVGAVWSLVFGPLGPFLRLWYKNAFPKFKGPSLKLRERILGSLDRFRSRGSLVRGAQFD